MRLDESVEWISASGERIRIATVGTPVHLAAVRGLDGLEQEVYVTKGSGQAGVSLTGASLAERAVEIDVSIARNPLPNRRALLRAFRPADQMGTLVFRRGEEAWHIQAVVEQAPVFEEGVLLQATLALICPAPALLEGDELSPGVVDIALWVDDIEFDFEIPPEGHELAHRAPALIVNAVNHGDMDAGCRIVFTALGEASNPGLVNARTQERLRLTMEMQAGDEVTVATGYGQKRITLRRAGVEYNAFNALDAGSTWLQIHPGDNFLRYMASENLDNIEVRVYYNSAYSGV